MKRTPCEYLLWNLLPALRSEIARCMVYDFGLSQKEAAKKLEIQPAAVCMYLSDKRGKSNFKNKVLLNEIKIAAQNIIQDENRDIVTETCRLCKFIKSKRLFPFSNDQNK
jgi:predicted transcriptional regulator